jgi:hypothetical protein
MPDDPILFDRRTILDALTELVAALHERGVTAGIRLIGGAAIALAYDAERPPTTDVDALLYPSEPILAVATEIAQRRGWKHDWLNDKAVGFMTHHDTAADWTVVLQDGDATASIASAELLFAMKLNACRGVRDGQDLLTLADVCGVTSISRAEAIFDRYFPRDVVNAKGVRWLEAHFRGENPFDV